MDANKLIPGQAYRYTCRDGQAIEVLFQGLTRPSADGETLYIFRGRKNGNAFATAIKAQELNRLQQWKG